MWNSKASIVVGIDFGPTFSGFAFALTSSPDELYKCCEWPDQESAGRYFCKTSTRLLYDTAYSSGPFVLQDWGYSALVQYARGNRSKSHEQDHSGEAFGVTTEFPVPIEDLAWRTATHFLHLFKIYTTGGEHGMVSAAKLPEGLTVRRVISDYLRKFSEHIMRTIQGSRGSHLTMEDVLWCLTVPAIWDDLLKGEMMICASMAGMTKGAECPPDSMHTASPHPLMFVIEPEAASFYIRSMFEWSLYSCTEKKLLIVDVDSGSVDLVLHKKTSSGSGPEVKNLSRRSGGLFGGPLLDKAFFDFLSGRISCFRKFTRACPESASRLKGWWETIKNGFDGDMTHPWEVELPARLARAWEEDESSKNRPSSVSGCYDAVNLSVDDMFGLFDPICDYIIHLIRSCMIVTGLVEPIDSKISERPSFNAMMITGSFAGSPYLKKRIRQEFGERMFQLVLPGEPESVLSCGAVNSGIERAGWF